MYQYQEKSDWVDRIAKVPFPIGTFFFLLTSPIARQVFKRVVIDKSTDTALHPIYEYSVDDEQYTTWDHRWQSSYAAQSLRFRFNWIQQQIEQILHELTQAIPADPINVISLGAGTGLAFLNSLQQIDDLRRVKVLLVDQDQRAVERAQAQINAMNLTNSVEPILGTSSDVLDQFADNYFHLVELVGIAEYVTDDWLEAEARKIARVLNPQGSYIGAAISSDEESGFAHKVLHWPTMQYRSEDRLREIMQAGGFSQIEFCDCGVFKGWIAKK